MNKNIIIAILIVVIVAIVAFVMLSPQTTTEDGKINTQINILSKDTLKNGEKVEFELKDAKGNVLKDQKVSIEYTEDGNVQKYSVLTDNNGHAFLALNNEPAGKHDVKVIYNGTDKYNGCSAQKTITIEEGNSSTNNATKTGQNSTASTARYNNGTSAASSSSSSKVTETFYDADLNVYYDSNGRVIGGQVEGSNIWDLRNNPQQLDENGSLV